MKYFILSLLLGVSSFAHCQIVFGNKIGTPDYQALTMISDVKNPMNTLFIYSSGKYSPFTMTIKRDTTISGVQLLVLKPQNQVKPFFLSVQGDLSFVTFFDQDFHSFGEFTNDSFTYNNLRSKTLASKPAIDTSMLIGLFKLLLL